MYIMEQLQFDINCCKYLEITNSTLFRGLIAITVHAA